MSGDLIKSFSRRASNFILSIGGFEKAAKIFSIERTFTRFQHVGRKTNEELIKFFEIYELNLIHSDEKNKDVINQQETLLIEKYLWAKSKSSTRVINLLNENEKNEHFYESTANKHKFIYKFFFGDFKFESLRNLGHRSLKDILEIKQYIEEYMSESGKISAFDNNSNNSNDILLNPQPSYTLSKKLNFVVPEEIVKNLEQESNSLRFFHSVLIEYLLRINLNSTAKQILTKQYFSIENYSRQDLCDFFSLSRERIRQHIVRIDEHIIPGAISAVLFACKDTYSIELFPAIGEIFEIHEEKFDVPSLNDNQPNKSYYLSVYKLLLRESHTYLNQLVLDSTSSLLSFVPSDGLIFVSNNLLDRTQFKGLLAWADQEIFNFEVISFDYNNEVLIRRFYIENEINIDVADLKQVSLLLSLLKRTQWDVYDNKKKKAINDNKKEELLCIIEEFIRASCKTMKTADILDHLVEKKYEIRLHQLLTLLGSDKLRIRSAGTGYWGTPEMVETQGSLRSIVSFLLTRSDIPLHISEILNHISAFRPTNERSIITNLQMVENDMFIFFNCKFIGLKGKIYDDYWYDLPKTLGRHFRTILLREFTIDKLSNEYLEKYRYPEIHTRYLYETKLIR
jgi:hypothetical protein